MKLRVLFLTAFSALIVTTFLNEAHARLPLESDLTELVEVENRTYDVQSDGTYIFEFETRIAILAEAAREIQAVKNITFNSRASKFELIWAKTINNGFETNVADSNIEIKELGDSKVFDTTKEVVIAFPKVSVGSRIAFKYRLKFHEVPVDGFFSAGVSIVLQNFDSLKHVVRSAVPLYLSVNDKKGLLDVKSRKEGSKYITEISNREKIRFGVVQEDLEFADADRLPSVVVSTRNEWSGFAKDVVSEQERLLGKSLPAAFEAIRVAAMKEPAPRRMAFVAAQVAQEVRYFGDWRRRNGGFLPRPLLEIAATGYGDCKDLSLVVVAIARAMGLKADLAWTYRGDGYLSDTFYKLPTDYAFNHAIARVEGPSKERAVEWLDATNPVAIPGMILLDIADRPALVLSKDGTFLARTPQLKTEESKSKVELALTMRKSGAFDLEGKLVQQGRAAIHAERALLYISREQFKYETIRWLARDETVEKYELTIPESSSRVVRDLVFDAKFSIPDLGLQTTAGVGFPLLRNDAVDVLMTDVRQRFSDLWLGVPGITEVEYTVRGARVVGETNLDCYLKNDAFVLSRKIKSSPRGVEIKTRSEVLKSMIKNETLRSPEFAKLQSEVRRCFKRSAVILSLKPSASKSR